MKKKLFLLLCFAFSLSVFGAIKHIRWGSSGDPLNGLTITWRNNSSSDSIKWGYTNAFEKGSFAGTRRNGYEEFFFNYTFPIVTPSSTIFYKLYDSGSHSWGAEKTFSTAKNSDTQNFSFTALGDSRNGLTVWNQVSNLTNDRNSDLSLFMGDIVDDGGSSSNWNNWLNNGVAFLENNVVYHTLGNHEANSTQTYQNIFELPKVNGSNLYYSFTYGNAVFICLNSENAGSQAQTDWLINTLSVANINPDIKWKIIFFHKPFYPIGTQNGPMNPSFGTWWKAFDDFGVDLIINGHYHIYERTKPINRKISTTSPVAEYGSEPGQGRCQIITGAAGAPLSTGALNWAIEVYKSKNNFCMFKINEAVLTGLAYDNYGALIDSFTIDKTKNYTTTVASSICNGDSIFLADDWQTSAGTYKDTLLSINGLDSIIVTTLSIINSDTCLAAVGITPAVSPGGMALYPNPNSGIFILTFNKPEVKEAEIQVLNVLGETVFFEKISIKTGQFTKEIDLKVNRGTYFINVRAGKELLSEKLIIE